MSKTQSDTHLRYGQGILIKGYKQELTGVMTTKGFADTRARFETYDDILYFKNYRNAIFQILPASSFDINDQLRFLIENNIQNTGNNLQILKAKAKSQSDQFDLTVKSKNNVGVCFGDQVVLKHIDSDTYLSGTIRPAQGKNGAFSVQVTKDLKASLVFKLLPYRSFQNQSNPIPLQSPILIQNMFNKGFLTFQRFVKSQKKQKINLQKSPIKSDESYRIPVKTDSTNSQIFECVTHFCDLSIQNSYDEQMPWKFQLHFKDVENDNLIQHDIVYFQHTLNNGVLAAQGEQQIVLKQLKGEKTSQLCFYDCLWEIQQYEDRTPNSYILRHLMSGMTLGVDFQKTPDNKLIPRRPKLVDISDGKSNQSQTDKLGVIQLKLAKKQGGQISSKSYVNICFEEKCLDVIYRDKQRQMTKRQVENRALYQNQSMKVQNKESHIDLVKMANMAINQFNYQIKKLQFTDKISQHCFVIQQIDNQLKSEVLFALSFHSRLISLRQDLKWGAEQSEKKVTYLRMMQITQKTKEIKYFLKNTNIQDPNRQFKRPLLKRQIICLHLGISELLFELLYFLRKNRDGQQQIKEGKPVKGPKIFETKVNQLQKFVQMYNAIYEVIFQLIIDNHQFKVHVSKWISFIIEDVINYNEEYQLKTLLQLLRNNYFFVNNFVTQELVDYLVDRMIKNNPSQTHQFNQKKYIQIFRAFCICGTQVNSDNQVLILDKFIKRLSEDPLGNKYDIKLSKKKNEQEGTQQIGCTAAFDKNKAKWRKFNDYYKICRDEYPTAWSYMVAYLNLIADLVRGRNKTVQNYIDTTISLDVLSQLMTKQKLFDAQVPIIRIAHYLYAESEYFYPIDRVTRVCIYNELDNVPTINSTKSEVRPKSFLGTVMNSLIERLQKYGPIQVKNVFKNQCLYVILDFLKQTFILGFWQERNQVQRIYNSLYRLIDAQPNIDYVQIRQQSQKPQIVLMISCKQKCIQILELIIDLDIDFYLKYLCKTFKQFQIPITKAQFDIDSFLGENQEGKFSLQFFNKFKSKNQALQPIVSTKICPKIIELAKHSHPKLTSFSLKILQQILDFYRHISTGFINMIFVCQDSRYQLQKFISERRDKFFTLQYQTTTKISKENQKSLYFMLYLDEKDAGIMQDLFMISQLVKNQNSLARIRDIKTLDGSGTFKELAQQKLLNFTSQRRSSNIMKQKVVDASDIHEKVLKYIFNCRQIPVQQLPQKLLHLCYKFLVSIIENNQELKLKLIKHIPKMIHHISRNIGCIDFLKEMYDNNKNMLYNEVQTLNLIKLVCNTIQAQQNPHNTLNPSFPINPTYYKSKLLDFFRYLIYCNGRAFYYNQIQILKIMQDDSYKFIILDFKLIDMKKLVDQFELMNNYQPSQGTIKSIKMSPELTYVVTFFQIMISLIDDKCKVNSGKLIKKFPFDFLVDLIQISQKCWPLKRNIRAFLNRLYYFQSQIQTYIGTIRTRQIENIIRDMNYYIQIKCKTNLAEFQLQYFENPVRYSYLQSYLYLNLQQNLFTLYQILKNPQLIYEFKNYLHSAKNSSKTGPYNVIRICQRLGWIRKYFADKQNIFTTSFIKYLMAELRSIVEQFDDNIYTEGMMFSGDRVPTKQEKDKARKQVIEKIMLGQITMYYIQNSIQVTKQKPLVYQTPPKFIPPPDVRPQNYQKLIKKLRQILTRTKRLFDDMDDQIEDKQSKLITQLKLSKQIKQQQQNIYNKRLQQIIQHYKKMQIKSLQKPTDVQNPQKQPLGQENQKKMPDQQKSIPNEPSKQNNQNNSPEKESQASKLKQSDIQQFDSMLEYVSSIIQVNSVSPDVFSPQLKIFFLKMIIGIIEQSNKTQMQQKKPIDEWGGEDWFNYSKQIQKIQIKLKNGRLGTLIAQILKQNIIDNISLANSTLLCGIAYLLGGNQITQKNLIQQIKKDPDNRVFRNLVSLISKLGKIILKSVDQTNQKPREKDEFEVDIIDNYDFYDEKQKYCLRKNVIQRASTNQQIYYRQCIATYRRAFRFLQLLCQNNNTDNKHYIRDQPKMMEPVNFITVTTNQLRSLFEVMCRQIVDVPLFLLDFLMQVTQIPIKPNQQAIMSSSFFQDLCQMSTQFSKQGKLSQRGFEQNSNPLQQIYVKSVQIILSNFEGNDVTTYTILDSHLDTKFLINIIQNKFRSLDINNLDQLLLYIKNQLQTVDQKGQKIVKSMFTEDIMGLFDVLIIFMKLKQILGESGRLYSSYIKYKQQSMQKQQMLQHLQKSLIHIQINDLNNNKQTIYFAKHPLFYSLSENIRDFVMSQVKRDTHRAKIVSLIGYTSSIKQSIEYSYKLKKSEGIIQSNMDNSYKAASFMSVVICIYLFLYYGVIIEYGDVEFTSNRIYTNIRFVLSLIQLSMSLCYAYFWLRLQIWRQPQYKPKQKQSQNPHIVNPNANKQQQKIYKNLNFYRVLMFVIVSFYGTFVDPTYFFIYILDIFCQSPTLANVFKAIAMTFQPIALVSLMGIIFVAVFCTVTFSNYTKQIYTQKQIKTSDQLCDSMFTCLMALYVSGVINETMDTFEMQRFIYDTIYAIFFGLLFGNIISGIMIDAFSELRQNNDNLDKDKTNTCYICNISRQDLEKQKIKFKDHIKDKHFLWNYVFYIISLNAKNKTDYTGLEYQIIQQYSQTDQDMKIDWIPDGEKADYEANKDVQKMIKIADQFEQNVDQKIQQFQTSAKDFNASAAQLAIQE